MRIRREERGGGGRGGGRLMRELKGVARTGTGEVVLRVTKAGFVIFYVVVVILLLLCFRGYLPIEELHTLMYCSIFKSFMF